ncbi:hypothetical protein BCR34DRAFT_267444 [Clohesyomyces aquaticus]|uniref:Uncharacterized protein n=1 Tax=Clohesyomyces aquaticus TaxID=1231657 RepID=A0A1Y1ZUC1_9PLEO|nr:hypothetical protein BCR34DRAFT_267444 [Clohesyomyces aquaticus]
MADSQHQHAETPHRRYGQFLEPQFPDMDTSSTRSAQETPDRPPATTTNSLLPMPMEEFTSYPKITAAQTPQLWLPENIASNTISQTTGLPPFHHQPGGIIEQIGIREPQWDNEVPSSQVELELDMEDMRHAAERDRIVAKHQAYQQAHPLHTEMEPYSYAEYTALHGPGVMAHGYQSQEVPNVFDMAMSHAPPLPNASVPHTVTRGGWPPHTGSSNTFQQVGMDDSLEDTRTIHQLPDNSIPLTLQWNSGNTAPSVSSIPSLPSTHLSELPSRGFIQQTLMDTMSLPSPIQAVDAIPISDNSLGPRCDFAGNPLGEGTREPEFGQEPFTHNASGLLSPLSYYARLVPATLAQIPPHTTVALMTGSSKPEGPNQGSSRTPITYGPMEVAKRPPISSSLNHQKRRAPPESIAEQELKRKELDRAMLNRSLCIGSSPVARKRRAWTPNSCFRCALLKLKCTRSGKGECNSCKKYLQQWLKKSTSFMFTCDSRTLLSEIAKNLFTVQTDDPLPGWALSTASLEIWCERVSKEIRPLLLVMDWLEPQIILRRMLRKAFPRGIWSIFVLHSYFQSIARWKYAILCVAPEFKTEVEYCEQALRIIVRTLYATFDDTTRTFHKHPNLLLFFALILMDVQSFKRLDTVNLPAVNHFQSALKSRISTLCGSYVTKKSEVSKEMSTLAFCLNYTSELRELLPPQHRSDSRDLWEKIQWIDYPQPSPNEAGKLYYRYSNSHRTSSCTCHGCGWTADCLPKGFLDFYGSETNRLFCDFHNLKNPLHRFHSRLNRIFEEQDALWFAIATSIRYTIGISLQWLFELFDECQYFLPEVMRYHFPCLASQKLSRIVELILVTAVQLSEFFWRCNDSISPVAMQEWAHESDDGKSVKAKLYGIILALLEPVLATTATLEE